MARAWLLCAAILLVGAGALDGGRADSEVDGIAVGGPRRGGERHVLMKKKGKKSKDEVETAAAPLEGPVEEGEGEEVGEGIASLAPLPSEPAGNGACACIFGLENVIYQPENNLLAVPGSAGKVPKYASKVVNTCQEAGFNIGVVTDNCFETEIRRVLTEELESPVFTEEFLDSEALQKCDLDKTNQVTAVYEFYGVSPECAIYFDVGEEREKNATAIGVQFQLVGKKGVTKKAMNSGLGRLTDECGCQLA